MNPKTSSDLLFEAYLLTQEHDDFVYEQALPGSAKIPDYQLPDTPRPLLFEVKGFAHEVLEGFGYFDPVCSHPEEDQQGRREVQGSGGLFLLIGAPQRRARIDRARTADSVRCDARRSRV
jgi:hypothetical protein